MVLPVPTFEYKKGRGVFGYNPELRQFHGEWSTLLNGYGFLAQHLPPTIIITVVASGNTKRFNYEGRVMAPCGEDVGSYVFRSECGAFTLNLWND